MHCASQDCCMSSNLTVCSDAKHTAFLVKPQTTSFSYDQCAKMLNSEYEEQSIQSQYQSSSVR